MNCLIIDDNIEMKMYEFNLYSKGTWTKSDRPDRGIENMKKVIFDELYLDFNFNNVHEDGFKVLDWIFENLNRKPKKIISISFGAPDSFQTEINRLNKI